MFPKTKMWFIRYPKPLKFERDRPPILEYWFCKRIKSAFSQKYIGLSIRVCLWQDRKEVGKMLEKAVAYVDGSYNSSTGRYGYGVVFIGRDGRQVFSGYDVYGGRQIPGETEAVLTACQAALEGGYPAIDIYYDYEGIAAWPVGYWEAKKDYTARYADKMRDYMGKMQVRFFHAKAHTGIRGNEEADTLAKDACGMGPAKRESGGGYKPMVPEGENSKCNEAIRNFYKQSWKRKIWKHSRMSQRKLSAMPSGGACGGCAQRMPYIRQW